MEFAAIAALVLLAIIGAAILRLRPRYQLDADDLLFFAPAVGIAVAGATAFIATYLHHFSLITVVAVAAVGLFAFQQRYLHRQRTHRPEHFRSLFFVSGMFLGVFLLQVALFYLFNQVRPGPDAIWTVYNMTGTSPPDQMFSWHQAMFFAEHRNYPTGAFYDDFDLYDRPHLGGYVTLFVFKLFHLPLHEHEWKYPASALRFYHCFCWLLNNLYLFGVAALFKRLFGYRGTVMAIAATALSGFFILCNAGAWLKFAAAYPLLLACALFVDGKAPLLQACLSATSFYIHGSMLPFLLGFGVLQVGTALANWRRKLPHFRSPLVSASVSAILVGAWFIRVRMVGSEQPLFYFYWYDAELTQARTVAREELARLFYAKHSWSSLALMPVRNIITSILPMPFFDYAMQWFHKNATYRLSDLASMFASSSRTAMPSALGLLSTPIVAAGFAGLLRARAALKPLLCLYVIPTLVIAFSYRKLGVFSLHIMTLYQAGALFCWTQFLSRRPWLFKLSLAVLAVEGFIVLIFADFRQVPVIGIRLQDLSSSSLIPLTIYAEVTAALLAFTYYMVAKFDEDRGQFVLNRDADESSRGKALLRNLSIMSGVFFASFVINAGYCFWMYHR
jgi:hypothetical protein